MNQTIELYEKPTQYATKKKSVENVNQGIQDIIFTHIYFGPTRFMLRLTTLVHATLRISDITDKLNW